MKRAINLGCGTVIMPCDRPKHHNLLPDALYHDPEIQWDNADRNAGPGVNKVLDLFTYPWALESDTYDIVIAAHLIEHIPHHIIWNGADWNGLRLADFSPAAQELIRRFGQVIPHHPCYQDGWFAWFAELHRILKPGGKVYLLFPYAWSDSGISDPTHTRYLTLASINYLNDDDDNSPMHYRKSSRWTMDLAYSQWDPHERAVEEVRELYKAIRADISAKSLGIYHLLDPAWMDPQQPIHVETPDGQIFATWLYHKGRKEINAIVEFLVTLEAVKDADQCAGDVVEGRAVGELAESVARAGVAHVGAESVVSSGAAG